MFFDQVSQLLIQRSFDGIQTKLRGVTKICQNHGAVPTDSGGR